MDHPELGRTRQRPQSNPAGLRVAPTRCEYCPAPSRAARDAATGTALRVTIDHPVRRSRGATGQTVHAGWSPLTAFGPPIPNHRLALVLVLDPVSTNVAQHAVRFCAVSVRPARPADGRS